MSQVVENLLNKKLPIAAPNGNHLAYAYAIRICRKVSKPDDYTHIIAQLIDEVDNLSALLKTYHQQQTARKTKIHDLPATQQATA